ncbi:MULTISPECIES: DUF6088 family protein [Actibacterium]|uniref:Uncharacterized protein n=1 Tax=Actibacterium naphthalenivorans TaxID=1614693 RepID=A0A840CBQ0_9RHOB|nr:MULTISPECIES: DUF6088 family protein [Actibacterium]MBB4020256.1 hypothetical protein [Actibacterium naphthalenivorans]
MELEALGSPPSRLTAAYAGCLLIERWIWETKKIPSKPTYRTDGPTHTKAIGKQVIQLRKASAKTLVGAGQKTGAVFQALRYMGKDRIDDHVIAKLATALHGNDRNLLLKQSKDVPAWMHPVVQQIVAHA